MCTMCSREIFTKKCRQQQIFDSDLTGAWHYNHVTFTPIAQNFMLYCTLICTSFILSAVYNDCVSSSKRASIASNWCVRIYTECCRKDVKGHQSSGRSRGRVRTPRTCVATISLFSEISNEEFSNTCNVKPAVFEEL